MGIWFLNYHNKTNAAMRKRSLVFILCLSVTVLRGQVVSGSQIRELIGKAEDMSFQNADSALYLANQAMGFAQKLDSQRLVFMTYRLIGMINEDNNRLQEAQKAYSSALTLANTRLSEDDQLTIFTDWAIIHKKMGQYKITLEYHLLTIERAEKMGIWEMVEDGYNGLGTLYSMLSDYKQAIHYYLLSIQAAEKWGNKSGIVLTQQNISCVYLQAKNYDLALKNIVETHQLALDLGDSTRIAAVLRVYGDIEAAMNHTDNALIKQLQASAILEKRGDKPRLAETYLSIGQVYFQQKKYDKTEDYYNRCAQLKTFLPNFGQAEFQNKLGQLYAAQGKTDKAIQVFNASLHSADTYGLKEIAIENHKALAEIYNKNKAYSEAYQQSLAASKLGEILSQEINQKSITEAQFKFDIEKRDLEIEAQKNQLSQSKIIRWILIIGLLLTSTLLYITWLQMRKKQEASKRVQLTIKELHHRVKNNVQTIASMMRLQARQSLDPSVSAVLLENKLRLETFSMLHQQLYQTDDIQKVDLKPFITSIIDKLQFTYTIPHENMETQVFIEDKLMDVEMAIPLGLMLNELLTNSFKYAYPSVPQLKITIEIKDNSLHYADNGNSLSASFDFEKNAGFGMDLIKSFAQQLKGKYKFHNAKGFSFDMSYGG
jgi:two-component system, sensor histidine kinase PdtaS